MILPPVTNIYLAGGRFDTTEKVYGIALRAVLGHGATDYNAFGVRKSDFFSGF